MICGEVDVGGAYETCLGADRQCGVREEMLSFWIYEFFGVFGWEVGIWNTEVFRICMKIRMYGWNAGSGDGSSRSEL